MQETSKKKFAALRMGAVFLMAWLLISVGVGLKNFLVLKLGGTLAYPGAVATVAVMLFALAV